MTFATVDDVRADLGAGALPEASEAQVRTLIERAEARIAQVAGDPQQLIDAGRTTKVLVAQVVSEMVASVLRNRNARQSETETKGPFSRSYTVNLSVASGLLRLTDEHRTLLGLPAADRDAYTINPLVTRR